jgi:hypothetical protein
MALPTAPPVPTEPPPVDPAITAEEHRLDEALDEALEESFPASDPPAPFHPE